jgi:hypothetical protein
VVWGGVSARGASRGVVDVQEVGGGSWRGSVAGYVFPARAFAGAVVIVGSFVPHRIRGLFDTLYVSALIHFVGDQRGRDNSYESPTGSGSR